MLTIFISGNTLFVMSPYRPHIDVQENPVGYISDYLPQEPIADSKGDAQYANLDIAFENIPNAATITLHIELLNLAASHISLFSISSHTGDNKYISTSQRNVTHQFFPKTGEQIALTYYNRNPHVDGEFVRIMYTGLSSVANSLLFVF